MSVKSKIFSLVYCFVASMLMLASLNSIAQTEQGILFGQKIGVQIKGDTKDDIKVNFDANSGLLIGVVKNNAFKPTSINRLAFYVTAGSAVVVGIHGESDYKTMAQAKLAGKNISKEIEKTHGANCKEYQDGNDDGAMLSLRCGTDYILSVYVNERFDKKGIFQVDVGLAPITDSILSNKLSELAKRELAIVQKKK